MKKLMIALVCVVAALSLTAVAVSTHTNMTTTATSSVDRGPAVYAATATVDFSAGTYGSGDTVQMISVPAGSTVLALSYTVSTTNAATSTVDIGDDGSATRYATAVNMEVATSACGYSAGYTYVADNTIDLDLNNAVTQGVLTVWALIMPKP
jgi:hypothetical protein